MVWWLALGVAQVSAGVVVGCLLKGEPSVIARWALLALVASGGVLWWV